MPWILFLQFFEADHKQHNLSLNVWAKLTVFTDAIFQEYWPAKIRLIWTLIFMIQWSESVWEMNAIRRYCCFYVLRNRSTCWSLTLTQCPLTMLGVTGRNALKENTKLCLLDVIVQMIFFRVTACWSASWIWKRERTSVSAPRHSCRRRSSGSTGAACRSGRLNTTSFWPGSLWSRPSCREERGNHPPCPRPPRLQRQ